MAVLSGDRNGGFAAERVDDGNAVVAQPITAARLQDDVLGVVFLGDPDGAFERADRAAGGVQDLEGLVRSQLYRALLHFEFHGAPFFRMRRMHPWERALKR